MLVLAELAIGVLILAVASLILGLGLKMIRENSSDSLGRKDKNCKNNICNKE